MGFGIINFLLAIPVVYTIDTFGRRSLLLATFPFMALFHLVTGLGFLCHGRAEKILVTVGTCKFYYVRISGDLAGTDGCLSVDLVFAVAYSPRKGPVPFVDPLNIELCLLMAANPDRSTPSKAYLSIFGISVSRHPL